MEVRRFFLLLMAMMKSIVLISVCVLLPYSMAMSAEQQQGYAGEQLIKPEVERREISTAQMDTENFEVGVYVGFYATEDFGTNPVTGGTVSFHATEDVFIEFAGGGTSTQRTTLEEVTQQDIIASGDRELTYYHASIGYNMLPGESFIGKNWAFKTAYYAVAGAGNTEFAGESFFTIHGGFGFRFIATDWMAFRYDMRMHVFEHEILSKKETTEHLETHLGVTFFF